MSEPQYSTAQFEAQRLEIACLQREIERLRAENTRLQSQWLSDADLDKIARRMAEVAMDKIGEAYNASMRASMAYLLGEAAAQTAGGKDAVAL